MRLALLLPRRQRPQQAAPIQTYPQQPIEPRGQRLEVATRVCLHPLVVGTLGVLLHAAYRENVINNNTAGTVTGGVNMGANSCNGTATCP